LENPVRQSEHILYITLIDFLLQILFLGLVISVVYAASLDTTVDDQNNKDVKTPQENFSQIQKLTGISNITELTDLLTRLGPLQQATKDRESVEKLSSEINKVGGLDSAKKILSDRVAVLGGQGSKSCLPNKARIATFHVYKDSIELGSFDAKEFPDLLIKLALTIEKVQRLSLNEFTKNFSPVKTLFPDCKFNIDVIEHSFDTRPRDVIRPIFWPSSYKKAPDIR
jgi:hypothetical protein